MHERITDAAETAGPLPDQQGRSYTPRESEQGRAMTSTEAGRLAGRGEPLTRTERLLVTMFVTMFATMIAAGALGFTTLSGQLLGMQEQLLDMQQQTSAQLLDVQKQIGELSERMTRIETLIETRLVPASDARNPAGP